MSTKPWDCGQLIVWQGDCVKWLCDRETVVKLVVWQWDCGQMVVWQVDCGQMVVRQGDWGQMVVWQGDWGQMVVWQADCGQMVVWQGDCGQISDRAGAILSQFGPLPPVSALPYQTVPILHLLTVPTEACSFLSVFLPLIPPPPPPARLLPPIHPASLPSLCFCPPPPPPPPPPCTPSVSVHLLSLLATLRASTYSTQLWSSFRHTISIRIFTD